MIWRMGYNGRVRNIAGAALLLIFIWMSYLNIAS
jgi:hypothetical protein